MFSRKFILAAAALIALCSGAVAQFGPQISDVPCAFIACKVISLTATQSIGNTSTDGVVLQNTTVATAGQQQWSPRINLIGNGWKTASTAGSQEADWIIENQTASASAQTATTLVISAQIAGGGYKVIGAFGASGQASLTIGNSTNAGTIGVTNSGGATTLQASGAAGFLLSSGSTISWDANTTLSGGADTFLSRAGPAALRQGATDVDTGPIAQIFRSQGTLAGGTSNVAGANWTFIASPGKGTGIGGSFIFQTTPAGSTGTVVGTPTTALTLDSTQKATFSGQINVTAMTQSSAAQSGTVCYNSGTGAVNYDATLGCLTSLEELKDIRPGGISGALPEIMKLRPFWYSWKHTTPEWKGGNHETLPGLGAHTTEAVDKRLVGYGPTGKLAGVHYTEMVALLVAGLQEEHRDNLALRAANDNLERRIAKLERHR